MKRLVSLLSVLGALALSAGCEDAAERLDEVPELINCTTICIGYEDCEDLDFDTDQCIEDCEAMSDASPAFEEVAAQCAECVEEDSCVAGEFACTEECTGIVP